MGDTLALVRTAYAMDLDGRAWLAALAEHARPLLPPGVVSLAYSFVAREGYRLLDLGAHGADEALRARCAAVNAAMPLDAAEVLLFRPPWVGTLTGQLGVEGARAACVALGLDGSHDAVGVVAHDGDGGGVVLTVPTERPVRLAPRVERRLGRAIAHLAAAHRLRRRLGEPEAVADPDGRIHHAVGEATARSARDRLREAVRVVERARAAKGTDARERALESFRALVDGRWSLVDRFESDGKRFVVAHPNPPGTRDPRGLGAREAAACSCVGLGYADKETAYALGLSEAGVAAAVRRAMRKLGVRARAELAALFAPHAVEDAASLDLGLEVLELRGPVEGLSALTPSEREVAVLALRGASNTEIARARRRSVRTVQNQLASAFRKLGVSSRSELAAKLAGG